MYSKWSLHWLFIKQRCYCTNNYLLFKCMVSSRLSQSLLYLSVSRAAGVSVYPAGFPSLYGNLEEHVAAPPLPRFSTAHDITPWWRQIQDVYLGCGNTRTQALSSQPRHICILYSHIHCSTNWERDVTQRILKFSYIKPLKILNTVNM